MGNVEKPRAVVLTALQIEYLAVTPHLTDMRQETFPGGTIYGHGTFGSERANWDVWLVDVGTGNITTALATERAIRDLHPTIMFFVGVAGGLKDVEIGDVVVALKVYWYEPGKADMRFFPRSEAIDAPYHMVQQAKSEAKSTDWLQRIQVSLPACLPKVYVEPIASGEQVVASTSSPTRLLLQEHFSSAVAVEMEGHGFYRAAHTNQFPNSLIIRGISDKIDRKDLSDATGSQPLAARHASAFAFEVLAKLNLEHLPIPPYQQQQTVKQQTVQKSRMKAESKFNIQNIGSVQQQSIGDGQHIVINQQHNSDE